MCGITGWIDYSGSCENEESIIDNMTECLVNRGPDESGKWVSERAALGHRRLCVIDPEGGKQPMIGRRGNQTYVLIYNGELYNSDQLRSELENRGYFFAGHSDTEVLLKAYMEWKEECLEYLNGIFAFAVWEEHRQSLFLARDRLGVKPLFFSYSGNSFVFCSEIKGILAHPCVEALIDAEGLAEILVMGPSRTPGFGVFRDVDELKPGHFLRLSESGIQISCYWSLVSEPHRDDLDKTAETIYSLLEDAVNRQLVSDVPVATFLSGGLDSTALTAFANSNYKCNNKGVLKTFSVDYHDSERYFQENEFQPNSDTPWIKYVSANLGTQHDNIFLKNQDLVASLGEATRARDLPGMTDIDSSLLLFCREVKKEVKVVLSGECADEIFGGYPWFTRTDEALPYTFPWIRNLPRRLQFVRPELVEKLRPERHLQERYRAALAEVPRLKGENKADEQMRELFYLNITRFMPTLLDRKDRMSMAVGLEARVPFCDHRLVEYAWNIPREMKFYGNMEKGLLRLALNGLVPEKVITRKKSPYPVTHNPQFLKNVRNELLNVLISPDAPVKEIINAHRVKEFACSREAESAFPWFGQLMGSPQLLAYFIQLNEWMKVYNVKLNI